MEGHRAQKNRGGTQKKSGAKSYIHAWLGRLTAAGLGQIDVWWVWVWVKRPILVRHYFFKQKWGGDGEWKYICDERNDTGFGGLEYN